MSSLDFELDDRMSQLELEWREAHAASLTARADYQSIAGSALASGLLVEAAQRRMERAEKHRSSVMLRIEHLEASALDAR